MILETERLFSREFSVSDAENLFKLNSDPEVLKHTGDQPFDSISQSTAFIKNYLDYSSNSYGRWAVIVKSSNEFVGWCGLKYHADTFYTDLGFRFFRNHWDNGYATESGRGVIDFAFSNLNINSLIARVEFENKSSIKVLNKLGFVKKKEVLFNSNLGFFFELHK